MRNSDRWGVGSMGLAGLCLSWGAVAHAGSGPACAGEPLAALGAFQQAVRTAQTWDDTSYDVHLTQAARQRLNASRAKVDFSASLGQGSPMQGWTPQQTLAQRKATALTMLQEQVADWPLAQAHVVQRGAQQATVQIQWQDERRSGHAEGTVLTQRQQTATLQLQCEGGAWRLATEEVVSASRDVLTTPDGQQHAGSQAREAVRWP